MKPRSSPPMAGSTVVSATVGESMKPVSGQLPPRPMRTDASGRTCPWISVGDPGPGPCCMMPPWGYRLVLVCTVGLWRQRMAVPSRPPTEVPARHRPDHVPGLPVGGPAGAAGQRGADGGSPRRAAGPASRRARAAPGPGDAARGDRRRPPQRRGVVRTARRPTGAASPIPFPDASPLKISPVRYMVPGKRMVP